MSDCIVCGRSNAHKHHIVFRSQNQNMIKSPINIIPLCYEHHEGMYGVHGTYGEEVDLKYKIELQDKLFEEIPLDPSFEQVQNIIKIKDKEMFRLLKTVRVLYIDDKIRYSKEDVIRSIMGGKLYYEEELCGEN